MKTPVTQARACFGEGRRTSVLRRGGQNLISYNVELENTLNPVDIRVLPNHAEMALALAQRDHIFTKPRPSPKSLSAPDRLPLVQKGIHGFPEVLGPPIKFSRTPGEVRCGAPTFNFYPGWSRVRARVMLNTDRIVVRMTALTEPST